jgi:BlaI family penicillinase repressor
MSPPSDSELEILKLFWRTGPMSAREAQDLVEPELGWAVSTTRTVLDRMAAKGLLQLKSVHGMKVYAPAQPKVEVIGGLLKKLVRGVLEIDGALPAAAFTGSQILTPDEIAELEVILNSEISEDYP